MEKNVFKNLFKKVKASSMLEVLISFIICLIIFTISMRFILKVELSDNIKSRQELILLYHNIINTGNISTGVASEIAVTNKDFNIEVDTIPSSDYKNLNEVHIKVLYPDGRKIRNVKYYTGIN